jgi:undecaprenyl-diphosphatase
VKLGSGILQVRYLLMGIVAALLAGFGLIADEVGEGDTLDFDKAVLAALREPGDMQNPIGPPWVEEAARDITALGGVAFLTLLVTLVVIHFLLRGKWRTGAFLAFVVVAGTLISNALKAFFDRPRPDLTGIVHVATASFPSGHAAISAVTYLSLGVVLARASDKRRLKVFYIVAAIFLTAIVGLSRLYLGVHYPTDVAAGWALGSAWAILCALATAPGGQETPMERDKAVDPGK